MMIGVYPFRLLFNSFFPENHGIPFQIRRLSQSLHNIFICLYLKYLPVTQYDLNSELNLFR
jgi:hypothetical protein